MNRAQYDMFGEQHSVSQPLVFNQTINSIFNIYYSLGKEKVKTEVWPNQQVSVKSAGMPIEVIKTIDNFLSFLWYYTQSCAAANESAKL